MNHTDAEHNRVLGGLGGALFVAAAAQVGRDLILLEDVVDALGAAQVREEKG